MKSRSVPALRVSSKLRRAQEAFLTRGLASAARARSTGRYVPAQRVISKLLRRIAAARWRATR